MSEVWKKAGQVATKPCTCGRGWSDPVEVWVGRIIKGIGEPDEFYVDFRCPCGINKQSKVKV